MTLLEEKYSKLGTGLSTELSISFSIPKKDIIVTLLYAVDSELDTVILQVTSALILES